MLLSCCLAFVLGWSASGDASPGATSPPAPEQTTSDTASSPTVTGEPGIAWYADWGAGLAEAQRSQRPILLQFMRPACRGVSGVF